MTILRRVFVLLFSCVATFCYAQFSIPSMDVKLYGGASLVQMPNVDFEGIIMGGEINVHINENIAVGGFYSRDFEMSFLGEFSEYDGDQLMYGVQVRLSTDRSHKIRPYLNLNYYKSEFVIDYIDFRTAGETTGYGAGLGILVRLTNKLYLNAIDLSIKKPSKDLFLLPDATYIIQAHAGVSYNLGRKR